MEQRKIEEIVSGDIVDAMLGGEWQETDLGTTQQGRVSSRVWKSDVGDVSYSCQTCGARSGFHPRLPFINKDREEFFCGCAGWQ